MAAVDQWGNYVYPPDGPARYAVAVTPNDTVDLTNTSRALYVGGAGNLVVQMNNGTAAGQNVTFNAVPAGTILPIAVTRVVNTATSATLIISMW